MKKVLRLLLAVICIAAILICCGCGEKDESYPDHTEKFYMNDFAGVMSDEDADEIVSSGAALDSASAQKLGTTVGAQVVAVTVETTGDEAIAEYAMALGNKWGVGDKEKNNGVLILLATKDRKIYVSVADGLGGALPDSKTGRLIDDYAGKYLSENEFSAGVLNLYRAIVREVYAEYDIPVPETLPAPQSYSSDITTKDTVLTLGGLAVFIVLFFIFLKRRKYFLMFPPTYRGGFGGFGGSGGSGGSGGGFGGGGGSFGGGGAGRSF